MHRSASDSASLRHHHQPGAQLSRRYFICLCGNLDPDLFIRIEKFNPARDAISNAYIRVCLYCQFPVAEREGYAYCPVCDHESPESFRRTSLRPGSRLTLCLVCNSAVATSLIDVFFDLLDMEAAQLESIANVARTEPESGLQCPECRVGRLSFVLEMSSHQPSSNQACGSALHLTATCSVCPAVYALLDESPTERDNDARTDGCHGDMGGTHAGSSHLDGVIAPYLCECPDASFDRLHPVDHRRGGDSVSSAAVKARKSVKGDALVEAETSDDYESLYCVSCKSAIPLYINGQAGGPATLAQLRLAVKPRYSTGAAGMPRERQRITDIKQLSVGDHLCYPRRGGVYWHHGIVISVDANGQFYHLLHYSNYTEAGGSESWLNWLVRLGRGNGKGIVRIDRMDLAKEPETHRLVYHSLDCYPAELVVRRALSQANTANYHLLGENCEHLAVWAKSGEAMSLQVEQIRQLCYRLGSHLLALTKAADQVANRIKLAVTDSLAAMLKLRQSLKDLIEHRITPLVFSRHLWRALIRTTFVLITSAVLRMTVSANSAGGQLVGPLANGIGGALGSAVADQLLPLTSSLSVNQLTNQ